MQLGFFSFFKYIKWQYNRLNTKPSNSQLNKLKAAIKNENYVVIRLSTSMIGDSNDKGNFSHELLSTVRQVSNIRKSFAYSSSVDDYQKWYSQEDF